MIIILIVIIMILIIIIIIIIIPVGWAFWYSNSYTRLVIAINIPELVVVMNRTSNSNRHTTSNSNGHGTAGWAFRCSPHRDGPVMFDVRV